MQLCKIDSEGNARKVVGCSCVVVKVPILLGISCLYWLVILGLTFLFCFTGLQDYGETSEGYNVVQEHVKSHWVTMDLMSWISYVETFTPCFHGPTILWDFLVFSSLHFSALGILSLRFLWLLIKLVHVVVKIFLDTWNAELAPL
jgi:hypothetical protein